VFISGSVRLPSLRFPNHVITPEGFSSKSMPSAASPGANSGEKTLSAMISGLAAGTPLTVLLKTFTWSAATFEAAMVVNAIVAATSEQVLAFSAFLRLSFMICLCSIDFVSVCAAINRTLEHVHADCDEPVQNV
jgi:hypothetical protein